MKKLSGEQLCEVLKKHRMWLAGEEEGEKADLREACLRGADLRGADLREAYLGEADLWGADLWGAYLRGADLWGADLRGADLEEANLRGAYLWGADLDYSCWPLWCGSLDVKVDRRIAAQLCYHFCRLDCDDPEYLAARNAVIDFANTFHLVEECGRLEAAGGGENEK